jgi:hypothetical protein
LAAAAKTIFGASNESRSDTLHPVLRTNTTCGIIIFYRFGSQKMANFSYDHVTTSAADALRKATIESAGGGSDENQSLFDVGRGVIRAWQAIVGESAQQSDKEMLQELLESMPGYDDEGEGNWKPSPIVTL